MANDSAFSDVPELPYGKVSLRLWLYVALAFCFALFLSVLLIVALGDSPGEQSGPRLFVRFSFDSVLLALLLGILAAVATYFQQCNAQHLRRGGRISITARPALQCSTELLREIIDTIDRAIILWDKEQRLVVWNDAMEKMYPHIAPFLQVGMARASLREIRESAGEKEVLQAWESIGVWDRHLPDGRIVEVQRLAMADGGRLVLHSDVTESRLRLIELTRNESMASLGKLVAGVTHEINTPIGNALLAASTVCDQIREMSRAVEQGALRRSELDSFMTTLGDSVGILMRNTSRAAELIQHFKAMAVDQASEQRREFRLAAILDNVTTTLQRKVRLSSHHLKVDVNPELSMDSYPGALEQIVSNLVENALLHAFPERTGGTMLLEARACGEQQIEIIFRDNGCGISDEIISRVYEPFFTTKRGKGGSGLGLSIVQNLAHDLLGGEMTIHSPRQQGTIVRILLPRISPERTPDQPSGLPNRIS